MSGGGLYVPYDSANPTPVQRQLMRRVAAMNPETSPVMVKGFGCFSLVVQHGFRRVTYEAQVRDTDGMYFWITEEHAKQIGLALQPTLKFLCIQVTTFEGRALDVLTSHVRDGVQIDELTISHKSGDEVTEEEATGLARLATKLGVKTLHLWAGEYDDGVLDRMSEVLQELGNSTLIKVDVCDVTLPEPDDIIHHSGLTSIVEKNRK